MLKEVDNVCGILSYHTKIKLLVFHVVTMLYIESMNSLKSNEKKFINRMKYTEHKIFVFVEKNIKYMKGLIMIN